MGFIWSAFTAAWGIWKPVPSASLAISCSLPVAPRSMPLRSSSSLSRKLGAWDTSVRSVTCPTFIGRPASSKPFSCSRAFLASSESWNVMKP
uniref:Putative secreted protein n=1 Tax=Ixodes ricinus TaxID=34613 RepID=A0A6B0UBG9_IXORI